MTFHVEKEPSADTIAQIVAIAEDYTADFFTPNVPSDTRSDLGFQRAAYLKEGDSIVSFLVFTCLDGCPHITLFATQRARAGQGHGSALLRHFMRHVESLGFRRIELMTVLPQAKPVYAATVAFYRRNGFAITHVYPDMWEHGAVAMRLCW